MAGRWSIAIALTLALATACSDGGSPTGSSGTPAGVDAPTTAPAATPSHSGGGGYGHGGGDGQSGGGGDPSLTLSLGNYLFSPSTPKVASGEAVSIVNGTPDTPHTFTIEREDIDVSVDPGSSEDVKIDLPPGAYPFVCRFHEASGMVGTLTVT